MNIFQYKIFNMERDGRWWIRSGSLGTECIATWQYTMKYDGSQLIIFGKKINWKGFIESQGGGFSMENDRTWRILLGCICRNLSGHVFMGRPTARLETMALVISSYLLVCILGKRRWLSPYG